METRKGWIAGIDVHKKMVAVVVRQETADGIEYEKRKFGTTQREIGHLAAWLRHYGVDEVVMESTAQYWRPIWYGLEAHFRLHLTHPLRTRARRGRKWDFRDAQRLADRWRSGDLEASFVPDQEQRSWRWLTRTRVQYKRKMSVIRSQVEGLLEQGGIKLSAVVSDIFGVSGWQMLEKIAAGETDTEKLVEDARGALRKKKKDLLEALAGGLDETYRLLLKHEMQQVELLRKQIEELNQKIAEVMKHHVDAIRRLTTIPGVDVYAAQELVAEIGPRAAVFPSPEQFASWIGVCPGSQESAGVNYSARSAKGNRYLRRLVTQIAWAAIHTKDTFLQGLFHRLKPRLEGKRAAWAVAHRISKIIWLILHEEVDYEEKGPAKPNPRTLTRKLRHLVRAFSNQGLDIQAELEQQLATLS